MRGFMGVGAAALAAVMAVSSVAAARAPADGAGRAATRLHEARRRAHHATVAYQDALDEQARLEAEYAQTARKVGQARGQVRRAQQRLEARAVARYRGGGLTNALDAIDTQGPLEAGRLARVVAELAERDARLLERYQQESEALDGLFAQQRATRDAQREVVQDLNRTRTQIQSELHVATKAYQRIVNRPAPEPILVPPTGSVCPIQAPVTFTDDWHAPRSGGRLHEGNDIFAELGTPNVAVVDGEMRQTSGGLGGTGVWIDGDDGNSYYYAHLSGWEGAPRRVVRGEVVGYTGNTGNAAGGAHHTHFQIHPGGGEPVNPYPTISVSCATERGREA
jgi:peptidoglycan LD-endopeptidase LytH